MKNVLPEELIAKSSYIERRLIMYLLGKRGKKPGVLLKNPGEDKDLRLKGLMRLIDKGVMKIVAFDKVNVYFKFTENFQYRKISVSLGCYID